MTTLAAGSSVTVAVRDGGTVAIATNGGMASAVVTPTEGNVHAVSFGPLAERRTLGPYKEGASIVITNASCGAFDYDVETTFDPSSAAITGGWLNAKQQPYNAVGDGVADDTATLQSAIDAAFALGGMTVRLPRGTYKLTAPLVWRSGVSLVGDGMHSSILKPVGDFSAAIAQTTAGPASGGLTALATAVPLQDCTFRDFQIDGTGFTTVGPSILAKGLFILYMKRGRFQNLYIHHTVGTGLGCDFLTETVIDGVVAENCGRNFVNASLGGQSGIGIGTGWKSVESVTISNCHANNNGNYGIFVESQEGTSQTMWPAGARIVNCYAEGNRIGFGNKGSGGVTFVGCESRSNNQYGFVSNGLQKDDVYDSCVAKLNTIHGFYVIASLGSVALTNCTSSLNTQAGLRVDNVGNASITKDVHVRGGQYTSNGAQGIVFAGGAGGGILGYSVQGAVIKDNGTALASRQGIVLAGILTDGSIKDNWIGNSSGSTSQAEAVAQSSATIDGLDVRGNVCRRHAVSPAIAVTGTGVTVIDNPGYNPLGQSTLAPSASPWTYTAGTSNEQLCVVGTGVSVAVGGQTVLSGATSGQIMVPANTAAVVTYTTLTVSQSLRL